MTLCAKRNKKEIQKIIDEYECKWIDGVDY